VERLADNFADQVPEREFSPAEVLSILLEHRYSPESPVAGVEACVKRLREEARMKLKRELRGFMGAQHSQLMLYSRDNEV
jgi:hypothetical protein